MMPKLGTKLSDFSEDQLRLMLRIAVKETMDLKMHVNSINQYETSAELLHESVDEYMNEIVMLDEITTQIATELFHKESERTVASN